MHAEKRVLFLLTVVSLLLLSSCGKSETVQAVDDLIMDIGVVTTQSAQKISAAESAVSELTDRERKQLDNLVALAEAREQYNTLLIEEVEVAIDKIGTVTLNSGNAISHARKSYDSLVPELQSKVSNYDALLKAEETLPELMVSEVEKAISKIGNVSLSAEGKIDTARQKYNALEESLQSKVENYEILIAAEEQLFQKKVSSVENAIRSIGTVGLYSGYQIKDARTKYDEADESVKEAVTNYDVLLSAEELYPILRAEYVQDLISDIGTVTLSSEGKIIKAKTEYSKLTAAEKKHVTNYSVLTAAQKSLAALKEAEEEKVYKDAAKRMWKETDKVEGITWYHPNQFPEYIDERCYVLPYIGESGSSVWLRLRYNYTGSRWIFYEDITVWIDGKTYRPRFDYDDVTRDNASGDVWEYLDIRPTSNDIEMLWEIVNSKETIIRFKGDRQKDITISAADKSGIKDVLVVYEYMKSH